jgi:hypothetical protein
MTQIGIKTFLLPALFLAVCARVRAQDTQYWIQQFGTRSSLMGGAVVGGVRDNSAIFYNPAGIALSDTGSLTINASLYQYDKFRIKNALGNEKDIVAGQFKTLPLLFAGQVKTKNPRLNLGYGISSSVDFSFNSTSRIDGPYDIVSEAESPGKEDFIAQLSIDSKVNETWVGFGLGYSLSEKWSIGFSNLVTVRNQSYQRIILARFYLNTAGLPLVSSSLQQNFSLNHFRYSAKAGVRYHGKKLDLGLVVSPPSIGLYGKGTVAGDITATRNPVPGSEKGYRGQRPPGRPQSGLPPALVDGCRSRLSYRELPGRVYRAVFWQ